MIKTFLIGILFCFTIINLSASGTNEVQTEKAASLPEIRFAYAWKNGFNGTVENYKQKIKSQFILEPEVNIGIQHKTKILIDISTNNLPDIFTFWSYETNLNYLAKNNLIVDIQEIFNEIDFMKKDDFHNDTFTATEIDGINYAIPYERFFGFFVVNKAIFDKYNLAIPQTWDDIKESAPVLQKNGIVPLSMGSYQGDPGHLFFSALTYQNTNGFIDTLNIKDSKNFINQGTIQAAEAVSDLIKFKAIPENTIYTGSWDHQMHLYNIEKAAMIYTFNWTLALFDPEIASKSIIIPVPRINEHSIDTSKFTVGGIAQSICINKASWNNPEKRNSIIMVLKWLFSKEVFIERMKQEGCFPTITMRLPEFNNPIFKKVIEYVNTLEVYGPHEFYFNSLYAFDMFKEGNDLLWSGAIDQNDFLNFVQEGVIKNK